MKSECVQLLSKVSTPLQDEPLDSMLNVIQDVGYISSGIAWIIDFNAWVIKFRFPSMYTSMAIEIQLVDLQLHMGPKYLKSKCTPGTIEIVWMRGCSYFCKILNPYLVANPLIEF